jgi:hypothetical protein
MIAEVLSVVRLCGTVVARIRLGLVGCTISLVMILKSGLLLVAGNCVQVIPLSEVLKIPFPIAAKKEETNSPVPA